MQLELLIMKKYIYTYILIGIGSLLFMSNRNGRGAAGGVGSTGAPGDDNTVCQSCHNGPINVSMKIALLDNVDTVQSYIPNKEYTVSVLINHTGGNAPTAYGFQIVALKAALGTSGPDVKTWATLGTNTKITNVKGRQYVEQNDRSTSNLFQMKWIAPAKGSGPVSFYSAGNGVNSNSSSSGDGSSRTTLQISESTNTAIASNESPSIRIYPNPASEMIRINGTENLSIHKIIIRDLLGKQVISENWNPSRNTLDINQLYDGVYFVSFIDAYGKNIRTNKLVKKQVRA